ncbi:MAG: EAL domain-containing protein [Rhizobiaceae bacterium]|nr:EAL domain-containing protein [Rhizobiaceae bacterium]MCV0407993.1 EAL domain-containing protein [Rhizobiaceae bacterium]
MREHPAAISLERRSDGSAVALFDGCELMSAFQPIWAFPATDKRPQPVAAVAYEGLLRVVGERGEVSPKAFLSGLVPDMRARVETVSRALHLINAAVSLPEEALVFVNIDPSLVDGPRAVARILREMRLALRESELPAARVVCELTEQPAGSDAALAELAAALRVQGHRIAVDDYGAQASDAARVDLVGPDIVKFDADWIRRHMDSPAGFALLVDLVERLAARDIATVFEGMEEGWQIELAERAGATMVQGYGLARPAIAAARDRGAVPRR